MVMRIPKRQKRKKKKGKKAFTKNLIIPSALLKSFSFSEGKSDSKIKKKNN